MAIRKSTLESMAIKKVLVTGSHGYIGSVLMNDLLKINYSPVGVDIGYYLDSFVHSYNHLPLLQKDIRDISEKDFQNVDAVIHLAALSNDATGEIEKKLTEDINYKATVKLAKLAKKSGVKRFIFSSSCSVYGIAKDGIVNENSPINPLTQYSINKVKAEEDLLQLADKNFCVIIMRNATVYGASPCFRDDLVVNNLTMHAIHTNQIRIMSDGTPWRPLIDVKDLSNIFITFLKADKKKVNGEIFNVGFDKNNVQVKDIALLIKHFLPHCEVTFTNEHGADARSYQVNFKKLHTVFPALRQQWPLKKSIPHLITFLRTNNVTKNDYLSGRFTRIKTLKNYLAQNK